MEPHNCLSLEMYGDSSGCGVDRGDNPHDLLPAWGHSDEHGQDLAEYGMIMALISIVVVIALGLIGQHIQTFFDTAALVFGTIPP